MSRFLPLFPSRDPFTGRRIGVRNLHRSLPVLLGCIGLAASASAATTWSSVPTNNLWGTAGNWSGVTPTSGGNGPATTDILTFDTSSITTTLINGDRSVTGMLFTGNANFTTNADGASGNGVLYVYDGGITVQGGTQVFGAGVRLRGGGATGAAAVTVLNNGTLLDFNSDFMVHRGGSGTTTVTFDGSGATEVQTLARRTSDMNMNIVKNGTGTLTIVSFNPATATTTAAGTITGTTTINQGKIVINNEANLGGALQTTGVPVPFNAAHLTLNGGALGASMTLTIDDAHRGITLGASGGTLDANTNVVMTIANVMTGAGSLSKTGAGSVVLTQTNTYVGATAVSGGTLQVGSAGAGSITSTAAVTVNSGSTLAGTGTVAGATTIKSGAFLRAGDTNGTTAGSFSLAGDLTLETGSTTTFQLATRDATVLSQAQLGSLGDPSLLGTDDFINITGALNTNSGSVIALDFTGYTATFGDVFDLFDFNAGSSNVVTPTFTVVGGSLGGLTLDTSRFNDLGVVAIVPEPSQLALLTSGLAAFGMKRRRKAAAKV